MLYFLSNKQRERFRTEAKAKLKKGIIFVSMKRPRRRIVGFLAVLTAAAAVGCGTAQAVVREGERVKAFEASGRIDVRLRQGRQSRIEVDSTSRLYPYLQVWWRDGKLLLALRDVPRRWYRRRLRVDATVGVLTHLKADAEARLRSEGRIETARCHIYTSSEARVILPDMQADTLEIIAECGSRLTVHGRAETVDLSARAYWERLLKCPGARVDLRRLEARTARVEVRDGAKVRCRASHRFEGHASEAGTIRLIRGESRPAFSTGCTTGGSVRGVR